MDEDISIAKGNCINHEGVKYHAYQDEYKNWTIGVGHKFNPNAGTDGWSATCNFAQAMAWLDQDLLTARRGCSRVVPSFGSLPVGVRAILIEMAFQLGEQGLAGFTNFIAAISRFDFVSAYHAGLDSKWARTDSPSRAREEMNIVLAHATNAEMVDVHP